MYRYRINFFQDRGKIINDEAIVNIKSVSAFNTHKTASTLLDSNSRRVAKNSHLWVLLGSGGFATSCEMQGVRGRSPQRLKILHFFAKIA